jgi:hypothetical protein
MKPLHIAMHLYLLLAALSLPACAKTYSAKPITATVVDAETWEPLEGVNVVAEWALHGPTWRGMGHLELMEAVTDKKGHFHIPGWGPKAVPSHLPRGTRLGNIDPGLYFFKSGYRVRALDNSRRQPERLNPWNDIPVRYSDWDGKLIWLEKFKGSLEEYGKYIYDPAEYAGSGIPCPWKKTPRLYAALIKERERFDSLGIHSNLPSLEAMENAFNNGKCGSAREFFREYLQ